MPTNQGPQKFSDIINAKKIIKPPAYPWQDLALKIIDELAVPGSKRNSVFLVCKKNSPAIIQKALNDTKELCQTGEKWKYFFKLIENSIPSKKSPPQR